MLITKERTDHDIHQAVLSELRWDTAVDDLEVGVEVDRGIVTLSGTVSSYGKKIAAQEAAHRVVGVLDVANCIDVHVPGGAVTDTDLASAVRRALIWDEFVRDNEIQTTVDHGWVTLSGHVSVLADKSRVEVTIRHLSGVTGVTNNIRIDAPHVNSARIRQVIEEALERRAAREAHRLEVRVHDGRVAIFGDVGTWHEKQAILGAAGYAPGVLAVEDHLRIVPLSNEIVVATRGLAR